MENKYRVLLYYQYVTIEDPERFTKDHLRFCKEVGLKGRILVSSEGINGTVSGTLEQTEEYMEHMQRDIRFKDMVYKMDYADQHTFKNMHVRHRRELVTLGLDEDVNPLELTGTYLEPKEFFAQMQEEDTVVIDARNDYEYELGHFRNAINPDIKAFRELPAWIRENKEKLEGKKILTYCTGGVRCEKFSGWLLKEGFEDVAQLHGGIVTYGNDPEVKGQLWDGQCYVFDDRIGVPINKVETVVVGRDYFTNEPCERYVNCANPECDKRIFCTEENENRYMRSCSHECRVHPENLYVKEHGLNKSEIQSRLNEIDSTKVSL
ncbi:rhodanese-related sulfurtransferase [Bacillus sp. CECT 9360]|uniref:oxygen-dependent tRNA uridine(34) hydroxylase TrhO n=1 Tax=Bacillus sp. CECT 9360 TaxID=2845821 RepID=UPI001E5CED4A|nr:rhodanese-related sulfurtransferase [Bacillus sp. CECT 9360]CAH0343821.1 hypothetical protein BCI9360_00046 [Bacillus sp. CECT 9360]